MATLLPRACTPVNANGSSRPRSRQVLRHFVPDANREKYTRGVYAFLAPTRVKPMIAYVVSSVLDDEKKRQRILASKFLSVSQKSEVVGDLRGPCAQGKPTRMQNFIHVSVTYGLTLQ